MDDTALGSRAGTVRLLNYNPPSRRTTSSLPILAPLQRCLQQLCHRRRGHRQRPPHDVTAEDFLPYETSFVESVFHTNTDQVVMMPDSSDEEDDGTRLPRSTPSSSYQRRSRSGTDKFSSDRQWASSYQTSLWNADCKSAFLQGLPERPTAIYMRPPQDELSLEAHPQWRAKQCLYRLYAPVYGQSNAPRRWYLYVVDVLVVKLQWRQHSLDPCLFLFEAESKVVAVLGFHVDDMILAALENYHYVLDAVKERFCWGSDWEMDNFILVGRRVTKQPDCGFNLDQAHYVADVSLTKVTEPLDALLANYPELVTELR